MKQLFYLFISTILITGMIVAQSSSSEDSEETKLEQALALQAEQLPPMGPPTQFPALSQGVTYPLFVGVDDVTIPAYNIDPTNNDTMSAFVGFQVYGAGYDNVNDKIYFNGGATLYEWSVSTGIVTQLGTVTDTSGATQVMVSLAYHNGVLYGTKNIANEAVWIINPATLVATVFIDYVDADYDFGGLAIDPTTGEFYGTNDDATPNGNGLFRINMDGTGTLIEPYPSGETDIDGLAISDNRIAYFIIDQPGNFYVYDLATSTFLPPLVSPWTTSEVFCGGTWNSGIVPVELTSFTASAFGNEVTLLWQTVTETNNNGFSIERTSGNSDFEEIAFVPGFGTTTEPKSYSFLDKDLQNGIYSYRLKQIDFDGTFIHTAPVEVEVATPLEFSLSQNYPNPFNPSTKITFSLAVDSKVSLKVFDVLGQEITSLVNEDLTAGIHNYSFNAPGINSGIYFYKIETTGVDGSKYVNIKKMILVK